MSLRWVNVVAVLLLLGPTVARADIPSYSGHPSRAEDDRVRIDFVFSYHTNEYGFDCSRNSVGRWRVDAPEDSEPEVWLAISGLDHEECVCYLPWGWLDPEPVADATGQECTWAGTSSVNGTCPEPFLCNCHIYCEAVYDEPCNGEYRYSRDTFDYEARISVDWRGPCAKPESPFVEGCGCRATRGAKGSGPWPHVIVVLLFGLAALGPMIWHRRRAARRPCGPLDRPRPWG